MLNKIVSSSIELNEFNENSNGILIVLVLVDGSLIKKVVDKNQYEDFIDNTVSILIKSSNTDVITYFFLEGLLYCDYPE